MLMPSPYRKMSLKTELAPRHVQEIKQVTLGDIEIKAFDAGKTVMV